MLLASLSTGLGCAGLFGGAEGSLACPMGTSAEVDPPGTGDDRAEPDTELTVCLDRSGRRVGPQVERWADGAVAALGRWSGGQRDEAWIRWYPDGAFRSESHWKAGIQDGPAREVGADERITEVELTAGEASGWRALPLGTPMPEWEGGERVDGTRYRSHAGGGG